MPDDPRVPAPQGADPSVSKLLAATWEYLGNGGFWNPDLMDHEKVSLLVQGLARNLEQSDQARAAQQAEIDRLRAELEKTERALEIATDAANGASYVGNRRAEQAEQEVARLTAARAAQESLLLKWRAAVSEWIDVANREHRTDPDGVTGASSRAWARAAVYEDCAEELAALLSETD